MNEIQRCNIVGCNKTATKTLYEVVICDEPWIDMHPVCAKHFRKYQEPEELRLADKLMAGDEATREELIKQHRKAVGQLAGQMNEALGRDSDLIVVQKGIPFIKGPEKSQ